MRVLWLILCIAACSPAPVSMASSMQDPSNPHAPESRDEVAAPTAVPAPTAYACPMHPEVVSDHPGTCPKCGMHLVPK